jgi:signal transduction histidine kinase
MPRPAGRSRRHATLRKPPSSPDDHERRVLELFARIERVSGREARELAERAAILERESFVRKQGHELTKIVMATYAHARDLRRRVDEPVLDRARLSACAADLDDFSKRFTRFLTRSRDAVFVEPPHYCEEALEPIVEEARGNVAAALGDRAADLALACDISKGLALHVDHPALLRALEEIVQNAAESYFEPGARLEVEVIARRRDRSRAIEIVVSDRGRGVDEETLPWLPVPFGSAKPHGPGLGVFIARRMIEEVHGGGFEMESARGRGTRVRMTLPRTQPGVQPRRRLTHDEMFHLVAPREREREARARRAKGVRGGR